MKCLLAHLHQAAAMIASPKISFAVAKERLRQLAGQTIFRGNPNQLAGAIHVSQSFLGKRKPNPAGVVGSYRPDMRPGCLFAIPSSQRLFPMLLIEK